MIARSLWIVLGLLGGAAQTAEPTEPTEPPEEKEPASYETVVTGTRPPRPRRDVPATVEVIPREEIARSPALLTDGVVRAVPSVGLFRRTPSLAADPSSQGFNLRGLGPSAVSRALVLLDGVPVNDAFGGWVYWRSLPKLGVERVEIMPGGGSALYGNQALGGVMQLVSRPIRESSLEAEVGAGELDTFFGAARGALRAGRLGVAVEAEALSSGGYPVVAPWDRGAVDGRAPSDHVAVNLHAELQATEGVTLSGRVTHFDESYSGGTRFTTADGRSTDAALRGQVELGGAGRLEAALFGRLARFDQQRARVTPERDREFLSLEQEVPSEHLGAGVLWLLPRFERAGNHQVSLGADVRHVDGESKEALYPPGDDPTATVGRTAGGRQRFAGVFVEDLISPHEAWQLSAALRLDGWRNDQGHLQLTARDGAVSVESFAPRTETSLSPRVGVLFRPLPPLAFRASGWRAFRAPVLGELYRPFQVGRVLTAANAELRPETVWGGEVGAELEPTPGSAVRATAFWNEVFDPVANVTLAEPLGNGTRQRQNLGRAQVRGVELTFGARVARRWVVQGAYLLSDAKVAEADAQPELVGKQLAQNATHRATLGLRFDHPEHGGFTVQARWVGPQFEDDLNELPMPGYLVVDAMASRPLFGPVDVFASVENLFGREYLVGRAGVDTIGQPFTLRAGLRLKTGPR